MNHRVTVLGAKAIKTLTLPACRLPSFFLDRDSTRAQSGSQQFGTSSFLSRNNSDRYQKKGTKTIHLWRTQRDEQDRIALRSSEGEGQGRERGEGGEGGEGGPQWGSIIRTIDPDTLHPEESAPAIENVNYVASYNWIGKTGPPSESEKLVVLNPPTILVPGSPPAWTAPPREYKIREDSELVYKDINAAKSPMFPLGPAISAIQAMRPDYDFQSLDIVACSDTLENLLQVALSTPKPFRFEVDVIGNTLFFVRRENSPWQLITYSRGCGQNFLKLYTSWAGNVSDSCSHQRLIEYQFGGLRLLVRSKVDAYLKSPDHTPMPFQSSTIASLHTAPDTMGTTVHTLSPTSLNIVMKGARVEQHQILEIKTRNQSGKDSSGFNQSDQFLPRLWLNQMSKFVMASHDKGRFSQPEIRDMSRALLQWQQANAFNLARFSALLKRIVSAARDANSQQLEITWSDLGPVCIRNQGGKVRKALPQNLSKLWRGVHSDAKPRSPTINTNRGR